MAVETEDIAEERSGRTKQKASRDETDDYEAKNNRGNAAGSRSNVARKSIGGNGSTNALPEIAEVDDDWESDYGEDSDVKSNAKTKYGNRRLKAKPKSRGNNEPRPVSGDSSRRDDDTGSERDAKPARRRRRRKSGKRETADEAVDSALVIRSLELVALPEEDTEELLALSLDLNRKLRAELKRLGMTAPAPSDGGPGDSVQRLSKLNLPAVSAKRAPLTAGESKKGGRREGGGRRPWNDRFSF